MGWIPKVLEVDDPDEKANDADDFGKHVAKIIQLAFEGCLLVDSRRNRLVYIADGRLLTSGHHNGLGAAINNSSPLGDIK